MEFGTVVMLGIFILVIALSWWIHSLLRMARDRCAWDSGKAELKPVTVGGISVAGFGLGFLTLATTQGGADEGREFRRDYLIDYQSRIYGEVPFELHVTLTESVAGLLASLDLTESVSEQGTISFTSKESEPRITVEIESDADSLETLGEATQTKRIRGGEDTKFTFMLLPKKAEDLHLLIRIKYIEKVLAEAKVTELVDSEETVNGSTTKKLTRSEKSTTSDQELPRELVTVQLIARARSFLGLSSTAAKAVRSAGSFAFAIIAVLIWQRVGGDDFNPTVANLYLLMAATNSVGLTLFKPEADRWPWNWKVFEEPSTNGGESS